MRLNILVLALLSSAVSAQAGSIDAIKTGTDATRSVEKISCGGCAVRARKKETPLIVLAPGTQKIEIRDVAGVKKIFRTEAWLGGSPVTYVSKAMPDIAPVVAEEKPAATEDAATAPATVIKPSAVLTEADMIDMKTTTAAVTADTGAKLKVEVTSKAAAFDPGKLELRLN